MRVLAWIVALPIALVAVGIPARKAGYLNSERLLDVIAKQNIDRFLPLVVIVLLWALATAILVTLFLEGVKRLRRDRAEGSVAVANGGGRARAGAGRS
ncbi:MAG: hypothetical protein FJW86_09055 [Actinobacteria bacterium]|nr:hypothetical protein [Actinomycetota bacterium]